VNSEFTIGNVKLRGVELCEPCVILGGALSNESLATPSVIKRWVGRGGLRVDVLSDGEIVCGAQVELASGRIQRTRASRAADAQS